MIKIGFCCFIKWNNKSTILLYYLSNKKSIIYFLDNLYRMLFMFVSNEVEISQKLRSFISR